MKPNETNILHYFNISNIVSFNLVSKFYRRPVKPNKPLKTKSEQKLFFSKIQKNISNVFCIEKVSWFSLSIYNTKLETKFLIYILEYINNVQKGVLQCQ